MSATETGQMSAVPESSSSARAYVASKVAPAGFCKGEEPKEVGGRPLLSHGSCSTWVDISVFAVYLD